MATTNQLLDDATVIERVFDHIDHETTDLGETTWREPVENYRSEARFATERDAVLRRLPVGFCPSAALPEAGSYVARAAAGTPIVAIRGNNGKVRVPQRLPPPRCGARGRRRLREGVRLPLSRLDLRH